MVVINALPVQAQMFALLAFKDNYFKELFAKIPATMDITTTQDHAHNVLLDVQAAQVILHVRIA